MFMMGHPGMGHPAFAFGHPAFGHPAFGHPAFGHPVFGHPVIKVHGCKYCGVVSSSEDEILHDPAIHASSCPRSSRRPAQDMVGYHATNAAAARKILANGFRCGRKGLAGGAIYFATSEEDASRKSNNGNDIVLKCRVTLGRTLTLDEDGDPTMTLDKLNGKGYDSVKILRNGDEYAVYEPSRVRVLSHHEYGDDYAC
jgi:hypothetical protein